MNRYGGDENSEVNYHRGLRSGVSWIVDIIMVLILAVLAIRFYGDRITISGSSMQPVLESGDEVLLDKLGYTFSGPERFDVISFTLEQDGVTRSYVKRVIGLPGETVQIVDGLVLIDGVCPDSENEWYQAYVAGSAASPITLSEGEYFVMGDNRASSEDSRFSNVGNVTLDQIDGRLWLIVSPFLRMGLVR